jgi:hypothetical protein
LCVLLVRVTVPGFRGDGWALVTRRVSVFPDPRMASMASRFALL